MKAVHQWASFVFPTYAALAISPCSPKLFYIAFTLLFGNPAFLLQSSIGGPMGFFVQAFFLPVRSVRRI